MKLMNFQISKDAWSAANFLLKGQPNGTKLKNKSKNQNTLTGYQYTYTNETGEKKTIIFDYSFIVADNQIWVMPNTSDSRTKGQFSKILILQNEQGDQCISAYANVIRYFSPYPQIKSYTASRK